ncbi:MAG: PEP-CTERM sorting domain-containing protein [Pirellulaceae bacterium]
MKNTKIFATLMAIVCIATATLNARAADVPIEKIDFESGTVNDGEARVENLFVEKVTTPNNTLTFSLDGTPDLPVLALANSGVQGAFNVKDPTMIDDQQASGPSRWSLGSRTKHTEDYVLTFANPVTNFSIDLYDYRSDGAEYDGQPGVDTIQLQATLGGAPVAIIPGPATYTVPDPRPVDGNVVNLSAGAATFDQVILRVIAGVGDRGTAIDNIMFETVVPEPASLSMIGLGLVGLLSFRKRRNG